MTTPQCPALTEKRTGRGGNGETFCLGVTRADLDGVQGPSADGDGGRPGAMSALRTQGGPGPRASGDPQGGGHARRPPCVGGAAWGGRALGTGSREPRPSSGASISRGHGVSESRRPERRALSALARPGPFPPSRQAGAAVATGCSRLIIGCPRQRAGARV